MNNVSESQEVATKGRYVPPFELLTQNEVSAITRLSVPTIYRMMRDDMKGSYDPTFPTPIQVGGKRSLWRSDEITAWLLSLPRGARDWPEHLSGGQS